MINASSAFRRKLNNDERDYLEQISMTLKDGTELSLTNADIWGGSLSFDDSVGSDSSFSALGSCIVNSLKFTLNNIYDDFSEYDFLDAAATVKIGLDIDGTPEMLKKGVFTVVDPTYNGSTISLVLHDNMAKFDRPYSDSTLVYPASLDTIVRNLCTVCGVNLATSSLNFPRKDFVIDERPSDEATTCREVLSWCATIAGCFARCNVAGDLELKWFDVDSFNDPADNLDGGVFDSNDPNVYTSGDSADGGVFNPWNTGDAYDGGSFDYTSIHIINSLYSQNIAVDDVVITQIQAEVKVKADTGDAVVTYSEGQSGYAIKISGNEFINETNAQGIVTYLGNQIIGTTFRKANVSHASDPTIEAGDCAFVYDRKGNRYNILITRTAFTVGSAQTTVCGADTPARNSAARYTEQTKSYVEIRKKLIEQKSEWEQAVDDLSDRIDNAGGMYETDVQQQGGGVIHYLHNKPLLAESDIRIVVSDVGVTVTANGTDPNPTWYGLTVDGQLIASILNVIGINASWINTGQLVIRDQQGSEVFFADVDTGIVRISGNSISISSGDAISTAINQQAQAVVDEKISQLEIGGRNMLYDTNAPTLGAVDGNGLRYFTNMFGSEVTNGTAEWIELPDSPVDVIRYGVKCVCTATGGQEHFLDFYYATQVYQNGNNTYKDYPVFKSGQTYTLSAWVKTGTPGVSIRARLASSAAYVDPALNTLNKTIETVNKWTRCTWTFTPRQDITQSMIQIGFAYNVLATVYLCGFQLETGSIATDWSEYPKTYVSYGGRNLIRNTNNVDLSSASKRPNINGFYVGDGTHSGSLIVGGRPSVVEHGVKTQYGVNYSYPYIQFGSSANVSVASLYGLEPGQEYTFSFDYECKLFSNRTSLYLATLNAAVYWYDSGWRNLAAKHLVLLEPSTYGTTMSGRGTFTFKIPETGVDKIYISVQPSDTSTSVYSTDDYISFRNLKLEKGNRATDWSAAPEDIDGEIAEIESYAQSLGTQIDGKAETWYQSTDPSTNWTATEKTAHTGDLWYNTTATVQKYYRYDGTNWQEITSNPPTAVFDRIDGKAQVFTSTPTVPYAVGDLWFNSDTSDIMTCVTARSTGSYTASDWAKRNKYTDDTAVTTLDNSLNQQNIFNRLTNNGQAQGIYLQNGKLYLNFEYAVGQTLKLGGLNNSNGLLEVYNASGVKIGKWDKDGAEITGKLTMIGDDTYCGIGKESVFAFWNTGFYRSTDDTENFRYKLFDANDNLTDVHTFVKVSTSAMQDSQVTIYNTRYRVIGFATGYSSLEDVPKGSSAADAFKYVYEQSGVDSSGYSYIKLSSSGSSNFGIYRNRLYGTAYNSGYRAELELNVDTDTIYLTSRNTNNYTTGNRIRTITSEVELNKGLLRIDGVNGSFRIGCTRGAEPTSKNIYNSGTTLYWDGRTVQMASSSSIRYKHNIELLHDSNLDPHKLYNLKAKQFRYNLEVPLQYKDMYGMTIPGFIAEDVAEIYPSAVIHHPEHPDDIESWDERRIIPPMLSLIQEQHEQIEQLMAKVAELERKVS